MAENRTVEKRIAEEQKDRGSFADDVDENKETEQPMAESSEEDAPSPHKKKQKKAATEDSRNEEEEHDEIVLKAVPRSIQEQQPPKPTDPPRGTKVFCWGVTSASHYDEPISALPFYSAWPTFLRAMPPTVSSILARYDIAVQRPIDITALFFKTRDISDIAIGKHFLSIISQNTLFICSEAGPFKRSRICNQIPITQNSPFLWTLPEYCGPQVLGPTKPELITNGMALVLKHPAGLALEADMSSATITLQSSDISSSVPATSTLSPYPKFEIMRAPWAKQIFMGRKTVFVLATDGSVFARGSNASYQLGIGNRGQDSSENRRSICHYVQEFTLVTSLFERDVVSMAGASYYSVALTSDGHVFLAGTTISLGTHHIFTEYIPEYQKKIVQEARTATAHPVALAATDAFFVILFSDGCISIVWVMTEAVKDVTYITFSGKDVKSIYADRLHVFALLQTGELYVWGTDASPQALDLNTTSDVGAVDGQYRVTAKPLLAPTRVRFYADEPKASKEPQVKKEEFVISMCCYNGFNVAILK